jgi:hypothetical protein
MPTLQRENNKKDRKQGAPSQDHLGTSFKVSFKKIAGLPKGRENDEEHHIHIDWKHFEIVADQTICLYQDKKEVHMGVVRQIAKKLHYLGSRLQHQHGRTSCQTNKSEKCAFYLLVKRNIFLCM